MTRHPLLLAVFSADLLIILLILAAGVTAFRIALRWNPDDTGEMQLNLQAQAETASLATSWAFGFHLFATAALIYGLTNILPGMVSGAMCGTGVLQAMQGGGPRMIIFRLTGLVVLWVWWRLDRLNQSLPEARLVPANARVVLLALPVFGLAMQASWQASFAMVLQQPVDCCAVVYDQFQSLPDARRALGVANPVWLKIFATTSIALCAASLTAWRGSPSRWAVLLLPGLAIIWLPVAAITLVRVFAAYHYGVLYHHCPWCLFLVDHYLAGFPIWISWMIVLLEGSAILTLGMLTVRSPSIATDARVQIGKAARNCLLAGMLFLLLTIGPAVWWRLHFGMWITN